MKDKTDYENMSVFEQVMEGLKEGLAHGRGEITLKTTTLPAPPPPAGRAKVIELRKQLKMSQSIFAATLNVSTKLVQSWEQRTRKPNRGELRLIEILIKQPQIVSNLILANGPGGPSPKTTRNGKPASKKRTAA